MSQEELGRRLLVPYCGDSGHRGFMCGYRAGGNAGPPEPTKKATVSGGLFVRHKLDGAED